MIQYVLTGGQRDKIKIWDVVGAARSGTGGPTPIISEEWTQIHQEKLGFIEFGSSDKPIKAFPLLTCASLVIASEHFGPSMKGAVYHALAGSIPDGLLHEIHLRLERPPINSLLALYVFPNPLDDDYVKDLNKLESFGIPPNNVVYIERFPVNRFGINRWAEVGY